MSIEYRINGVDVRISREDYERIQYAERMKSMRDIERRKDRARAAVKAPEGMFAVYVWDPSNPEKSIPVQVGEPYADERKAGKELVRLTEEAEKDYRERNPETGAGASDIAYFVVNDQGIMV